MNEVAVQRINTNISALQTSTKLEYRSILHSTKILLHTFESDVQMATGVELSYYGFCSCGNYRKPSTICSDLPTKRRTTYHSQSQKVLLRFPLPQVCFKAATKSVETCLLISSNIYIGLHGRMGDVYVFKPAYLQQ